EVHGGFEGGEVGGGEGGVGFGGDDEIDGDPAATTADTQQRPEADHEADDQDQVAFLFGRSALWRFFITSSRRGRFARRLRRNALFPALHAPPVFLPPDDPGALCATAVSAPPIILLPHPPS